MSKLSTTMKSVLSVGVFVALSACGGSGGSGGTSSSPVDDDEQFSFTPNPDCPDATQIELFLAGGCPREESSSPTVDDSEGEADTFLVDCKNTLPCISDTEDGKYRFCLWGADVQLRLDSNGDRTRFSEIHTRFIFQPRAGLEGQETLILGTESVAITNLNQRVPWSRNLAPSVSGLTQTAVEFDMPSRFFDANTIVAFGEVGFTFGFDFQYFDSMTLDVSSNTGESYNPMFMNIPFEQLEVSELDNACPSIEGL